MLIRVCIKLRIGSMFPNRPESRMASLYFMLLLMTSAVAGATGPTILAALNDFEMTTLWSACDIHMFYAVKLLLIMLVSVLITWARRGPTFCPGSEYCCKSIQYGTDVMDKEERSNASQTEGYQASSGCSIGGLKKTSRPGFLCRLTRLLSLSIVLVLILSTSTVRCRRSEIGESIARDSLSPAGEVRPAVQQETDHKAHIASSLLQPNEELAPSTEKISLIVEDQGNSFQADATTGIEAQVIPAEHQAPIASLLQETEANVDQAAMTQEKHTAINRSGDPVSRLNKAADNGDVQALNAALSSGVSVDAKDRHGWFPLLWAVSSGHLEALHLLIERRATVDAANSNGVTALWWAAQEGNLEVVGALLQGGADVNAAVNNGRTSLWRAAQKGSLEVVAALLKSGAAVNAAGNTGATPLFVASQQGHVEVVLALLKSDAAVDAAMNDGVTPLLISATKGHLEVVVELLKSDAAVDAAETTTGCTPLYRASQNGHLEVVGALLEGNAAVDVRENGTSMTPLFLATQEGNLEVVQKLLDSGATVEGTKAMTKDGQTPFSITVVNGLNGNEKDIRILIHMLFSGPGLAAHVNGTEHIINGDTSQDPAIPKECDQFVEQVLKKCEQFWDSLLTRFPSAHYEPKAASSLTTRCQQAFASVWHSPGQSNIGYVVQFFILAPLLAKEARVLKYHAQAFWAGFWHEGGSRVWVDQFADKLQAEDLETKGRPLGKIVREALWDMEGERSVSDGDCHKTHTDKYFWTWVSAFYASLAGGNPSTYIMVNYGAEKFQSSFLWLYEAPILAKVCGFLDPNPSIVVIDLQNQCGKVIDEFLQHIQDECDAVRRKLGRDKNWLHQQPISGRFKANLDELGPASAHTACACQGRDEPTNVNTKTKDMWHNAMAAINGVMKANTCDPWHSSSNGCTGAGDAWETIGAPVGKIIGTPAALSLCGQLCAAQKTSKSFCCNWNIEEGCKVKMGAGVGSQGSGQAVLCRPSEATCASYYCKGGKFKKQGVDGQTNPSDTTCCEAIQKGDTVKVVETFQGRFGGARSLQKGSYGIIRRFSDAGNAHIDFFIKGQSGATFKQWVLKETLLMLEPVMKAPCDVGVVSKDKRWGRRRSDGDMCKCRRRSSNPKSADSKDNVFGERCNVDQVVGPMPQAP